MNYNWNWRIFWEESPDGAGTYLDALLDGLRWTLATAVSAWVLALIAGLAVGIFYTTRSRWLARSASAYIEFFRNIPLLVQMFLWYFVVPELVPQALGAAIKAAHNSAFYTAVLALGCYTSARVAVQVAAGIDALPRGQAMAARAMGMRTPQVYRYVLLPQAMRIIVLPMTSEFIGVFKNSAVALTIGVMELTARARSMTELSFQTFEAFTAATIVYVVVNICVVVLMRQVEKRVALPTHRRPAET